MPYGVWVEALDEYVASQQLDDARAARRPRRASLPSLGGGRGRAATSATALHRAMRRLLARARASDKPLVLVLDDLHWSDAGSVELLGALRAPRHRARRPARARLPHRPRARGAAATLARAAR